jgi:hypothetical protein
MPLVTRMHELQVEQRRETQWHPRVQLVWRKRTAPNSMRAMGVLYLDSAGARSINSCKPLSEPRCEPKALAGAMEGEEGERLAGAQPVVEAGRNQRRMVEGDRELTIRRIRSIHLPSYPSREFKRLHIQRKSAEQELSLCSVTAGHHRPHSCVGTRWSCTPSGMYVRVCGDNQTSVRAGEGGGGGGGGGMPKSNRT